MAVKFRTELHHALREMDCSTICTIVPATEAKIQCKTDESHLSRIDTQQRIKLNSQ